MAIYRHSGVRPSDSMPTSRIWLLNWTRSAGTLRTPSVRATRGIPGARSPPSGPLKWRAG